MALDKTFWWLMLFPAMALGIAVLIVWWTVPRKHKPEEETDAGGAGSGPDDRRAR